MKFRILRKHQPETPRLLRSELDAYVVHIESPTGSVTRYVSRYEADHASPDTGQHALLGQACSECVQTILRYEGKS